ncbi:aminotransferase class III-fold pyridoxal phosphate-dependent enzyme (plasmid) [Rhizobium sp. 32-5/1]|uniref:aminotransferase class III-fold pyridoxal phosphate-dependent enzyme n=1 Tax=Rhizobium sp. 32-5/1 TaxID=3019602 RepID=UPI00240D4D85|nr:aminotransferase class III-fold pyridoxal phosphate-dependent enzyme [Rhizobium sp. 32-5/1]WEZ85663.1 aminotransferase class III-fold pyridoxal phosphate-dependent enzyme [Rhizobium sp. 32-5/1]
MQNISPARPLDSGPVLAAAKRILAEEIVTFRSRRPRSKDVFDAPSSGFFNQVPQYWMRDWPMPFPVVIAKATGSEVWDIDGNHAIDFCLGDSGAMFGHGPQPILNALASVGTIGLTTMLPSQDLTAVGRLLRSTFGMSMWQVTATASDANRFAFRVARAVTGRKKSLYLMVAIMGPPMRRWWTSLMGRPSLATAC